jgi:DTW domain-containing protein YfiP
MLMHIVTSVMTVTTSVLRVKLLHLHLFFLLLLLSCRRGVSSFLSPHPAPHRPRLIQASTALDSVEEALNAVLERHSPSSSSSSSDGGSSGGGGSRRSSTTAERRRARATATASVLALPPEDREALAVAARLRRRLDAFDRNKDCRRCWLQQAHCVCDRCPPLADNNGISAATASALGGTALPPVRRIFLLMHHKEVMMAVDTAKLLLAAFPEHHGRGVTGPEGGGGNSGGDGGLFLPEALLVVSGIGGEFQRNMAAMLEALQSPSNRTIVLWPSEDAVTVADLAEEWRRASREGVHSNWNGSDGCPGESGGGGGGGGLLDVVVIDGTWAQARKLHASLPTGAPRVRLSDDTLEELEGARVSAAAAAEVVEKGAAVTDNAGGGGMQLRRHPTPWREISTLEATCSLLDDLDAAAAAKGEKEEEEGTYVEGSTINAVTRGRAASSPSLRPLRSTKAIPTAPSRWSALRDYQRLADAAARKQLGPPRISQQHQQHQHKKRQ